MLAMLALALAPALALAGGGTVSWTLSTEGAPFQNHPVAPLLAAAGGSQPRTDWEAKGLAAPRDICTPVAHHDCWYHDIKRLTGVRTVTACCAACKATPGCGAWTYDTTPPHPPLCYVKSSCGKCVGSQCTANVTAVSGVGPPAPPPTPPGPAPGAPLGLAINTSATRQTMEGFGGCFNEKGWDALSVLNASARAQVMRDIFGEGGLRYTINRMPIGSSDFADSYYSLDDTAGDFAMAELNLDRDNQKLIPYIKAAMAVNPSLKVWGSPWTAPEWLKDSAPQAPHDEGCGSLSPDPRHREAYALYLARAAKAYRAAGLNFEHVAIQNEPNQGAVWRNGKCGDSYPKMHWTGEELHAFLRDHLGPVFARLNLTDVVGIFLATLPVDDFQGYVQPALADPQTLRYLTSTLSFHHAHVSQHAPTRRPCLYMSPAMPSDTGTRPGSGESPEWCNSLHMTN